MLLVDGIGYSLEPSSEEELVRALLELDTKARAQGTGRIVKVIANPDDMDSSPTLSIALGGDESLLFYDEGGGQGYFSKGSHEGDTTQVDFAFGDSYSYYQRWMLIDRGTAIEAAREFFRTGGLPSSIDWVEF